ncbi:Peptidyl-prolyl cis-trans isomerase CYP23 [Zea mays]|uniref:Peptidyl-prolyl cis-trans isomerase CYP23 n=1 Tax=Zea mays TaxID=4577 RepID=A0A317Y429_MAIZE|nr:Peptidyl-prolyl cis-trans isomerase CYP23 [Zea mays]
MQTSLVAAQLRPTLDVPDLLRHADLVIRGQPHRGGRAAPQAGAHLRLAVREKTNFGDIEFGFFPHVAPKTVEHIFKLVRLGCYNTNHFFRVDKGFVAQVADVMSDIDLESCEAEKSILRRRLSESASEVERWRRKCFA